MTVDSIVATNAVLAASKIIIESVRDWNALITPEWVTKTSFDTMIRRVKSETQSCCDGVLNVGE